MVKKELLIPVWDTDIVYDESIMMLRDKNGVAEAPLLFEAEEIISVTNAAKTEEYAEGKDWIFKDNKIVLTENSPIYCFANEEYFPAESEPGKTFPIPDGNIVFSEGSFFIFKQIAVTYKCKKGQWQGVKPQLADKLLTKSFKKLRNGVPFRMVLFGDSISFGANASKLLNVPPFQPNFGEMFYEAVAERYGKQVSFFNTSRGGMDAVWAINTIDDNLNYYNPDLAIIGYGMNDFRTEPKVFEEQIREVIKLTREKNPDCEFILIATSLPNPLLTAEACPINSNQKYFLSSLKNIEADTEGVAVADITSMHSYLMTKKRYFDMTSNNVNHPNDFFYRLHAQYLCGMMVD